MIAVNAKYVNLSSCECGYPALHEEVPLGKIYRVFPDSIAHGKILCGGCRRVSACPIISTEDGGWLPLGILELGAGA
jgi:hypothetical protein